MPRSLPLRAAGDTRRMALRDLFHPHTQLERDRSEFVVIVVVAAALSFGAVVGVAWAAGVGKPGPSLTIPWIAGFGAGSLIAVLLVSQRERITASKGWRRTVGESLEAIAVLPRLFGRTHLYGLAFVAIALYWFGDIFC